MSRIVVVTGASGGIGRASAVAFGARGDTVVLIARGTAGLEGAAEEVRRAGGTALVMPLDVADHEAVQAAVDRIESEVGAIDVWVNVAFATVFARFWHVSPEEYKRATDVSYLGYVYATRAVLEPMMRRDRGTIVHVGSALAQMSRRLMRQVRQVPFPPAVALPPALKGRRRARPELGGGGSGGGGNGDDTANEVDARTGGIDPKHVGRTNK